MQLRRKKNNFTSDIRTHSQLNVTVKNARVTDKKPRGSFQSMILKIKIYTVIEEQVQY
jgi:hypothetical protein